MNEELEMDLEIVELGDAKEETKGYPVGTGHEDVQSAPFARPI